MLERANKMQNMSHDNDSEEQMPYFGSLIIYFIDKFQMPNATKVLYPLYFRYLELDKLKIFVE